MVRTALVTITAAAALSGAAVASRVADNVEPPRVYFVNAYGHLQGVVLSRTSTPRAAMLRLLRGPTGRLSTSIPKRTRLAALSVSNHTARVRLIAPRPRTFDFYATAQVVYTLTSFPAISRVESFVNGRHCCISTLQGKPVPVLTRAMLANWQGAPLGP